MRWCRTQGESRSNVLVRVEDINRHYAHAKQRGADGQQKHVLGALALLVELDRGELEARPQERDQTSR